MKSRRRAMVHASKFSLPSMLIKSRFVRLTVYSLLIIAGALLAAALATRHAERQFAAHKHQYKFSWYWLLERCFL
ncbi:MAG: hypothetical protein NTV76_02230 [Pseudomonas sp.]|nr:hypothetical protein [Pseudomonas sp.]